MAEAPSGVTEGFDLRRLGCSIGAEICGLDVTEARSSATLSRLHAAFLEHQVLVFREQRLEPEQLVEFTRCWGDPYIHPVFPHLDGHPEIVVVQNTGHTRHVNAHWHADATFDPRPPKATLLQALEMPTMGGDTQFANQYLAYDSLSPGMRNLLEGLQGEHEGIAVARLAGRAEAPSATHPVVRTHPETGRKALFVCRAFTRRFEGWSQSESAPLLDWLFAHSSRYEFTYRHRWRSGDLLLWDNRCALHYAIHDHGDARRLMHRTTVEGNVPA